MKGNKHFYRQRIIIFLFMISLFSFDSQSQTALRPKGFKDVKIEIPSVLLEIRYFGTHNFIGKPIDGYHKPLAILSEEAIQKLKKIQAELKKLDLGLKIFDAYRPQSAVDSFVSWAKVESDTLMKAEFYPEIDKKDLFKLGYLATRSGHTRGSTVDLTLVHLETGKELDMGSPYDFFGKASWTFDRSAIDNIRKNRLLLRGLMLKNNFKPYQYEWWHFTLKEEPYPNTYFNFPIE
ncbi:M15 family metallopeptidase [Flavicella sp.]|uniref:M15 family metallopeptidase n=1 Tax=Flavicella sp. TaxID=2957742 RepID=UPI003016CD6F